MNLRHRLRAALVATALVPALIIPASAAAANPGPVPTTTTDPAAEAPELSIAAGAALSRTVVFHSDHEPTGPGTDSFTGPPSTIWCTLGAFAPRTASLVPTRIEVTAQALCTWPMPTMVAAVSLFRGTSEAGTGGGTGFNRQSFTVMAEGPCRSGTYTGAATATIFAPPGYSPTFRQFVAASGPVHINAAGTPVPPLVCKGSSSTPPPPPPPSDPPVVHSVHCEFTGNSQFFCSASVASGWTQIRWSYNSAPRPGWNDLTHVQGTCSGSNWVEVEATNASGTSSRGTWLNCVGEPR